jgi:hypothetical protein
MITLDKYEQQIILACKYWGEWAIREDRLKAVKVVMCQYYGLEEYHLRDYAIFERLYEILEKSNPLIIKRMIFNMFQDSWTGEWKKQIDMNHMIRKVISELSCMSVLDENNNPIFEQLEPDYSILNKGLDDK